MSKRLIYITLFSIIILTLLISSIDEEVFKINKSFELLGEVYRNINDYYVDDVDPEELFNAAINGMLSLLDPYSVFYNESNEEDVEFIKTGEYVGFGMTISVKQGMLTITKLVEGSSAFNSGLRIGDRIYKIDTTVVIKKPSTSVRKFSRGKIGERVDFKIIRDGINDTLEFTLTRMKIVLPDVKFSDIIRDSIGYIKLDRFTTKASEQFKEALRNLNKTEKLKSLIIDLRDNPGGLMFAAVEICGLFVPENTVIVTLKDRFGENKEYKTYSKPLYPNLPIIILINSRTASASEIVAGALQDLDRAVIVGEKSFGKGLVQSILPLPYETFLKITTSKYYIPSGRCIQKIQYGKKEEHQNHIFYTKNGRVVKESIGIIPDSTIPIAKKNFLIEDLSINECYFNFANYWSSKFEYLPYEIKDEEKIFNDFLKFLKKTAYFEKTTLTTKINEIEEIMQNENFSNINNNEFIKFKKALLKSQEIILSNHKNEIYQEIKKEVMKRFYSPSEYYKFKIKSDEYIKLASDLLIKKKYEKILDISKN